MSEPVLDTILGLGVGLGELADAMGVVKSTLSQWRLGRRTMSQAVRQDLSELAALLKAYAARGLEPQAALTAWHPSTLVTKWGRETVEAQSLDVAVTGDLAEALLALRGADRPRAQLDIFVRAACREAGAIGQAPGPLTIEQRMRLRRLAQFITQNLEELNRRDATEKEER
jgi:transcriptional regulator with XRE-family HTH domain